MSTYLTDTASTTLPWITAKLRAVTGTVRKAVNNSIAGFIAGRAFRWAKLMELDLGLQGYSSLAARSNRR